MRIPLPAAFLNTPIAHRALHNRSAGRVENSRAAIRAAIDAGYGIEMDVQLSSDGQAMVFHDETLDRLTAETGALAHRSTAELCQIRLSDSQETIPTLPEILALVAGRAPLLIEIKDQQGALGPTDGRLEMATADAINGYSGSVALMSFNPHSVERMVHLAPTRPRGLTTSAFDPEKWAPLPAARCTQLRDIPDMDRCEASFISHEASDLSRARVATLKAAGAAILCWTITSPYAERDARKVADNITFEGYLADRHA